MKNGANALIQTLLNNGIDTCFSNPGTSEMHFVAGLDSADIKAVLVLFEGVATGAADGYARIADKPAATLLHLGCGLGNGIANLHNARRARVPMINIVGEHATYHLQYDAPLQSDIETLARNCSKWVKTSQSTKDIAADTAEAIQVATTDPQQISTLILPADVSWGKGGSPLGPIKKVEPEKASEDTVERIAHVLKNKGKKTAIILGRRVLKEEGLTAASKISEKTGAKLFTEVFPTRLQRGAGLPWVERLAYFAELVTLQLAGYKHLVLIDAPEPVSFFAYPGKKSYLVPKGTEIHHLVTEEQDALGSLHSLVKALDAEGTPALIQALDRPKVPTGKLNGAKVCKAIGALMPENAIICDEAQTSGVKLPGFTSGAPRHDLLTLTGGSIGIGLPLALGAATAAKDRPVIALVGDGSSMYTFQALWSIAQENLNVTVVILNNRSYGILNIELERVGAEGYGPKAKSQLDLSGQPIDFVSLSKSMGVPAVQVSTSDGLCTALENAFSSPGPHLIDAIVPSEYEGLKLKALPHLLETAVKLPSPIGKAIKKKMMP